MMKNRTKRISLLKMEIEELNEMIQRAEKSGKKAFASRLRLIHEDKTNRLNFWITNS